MNRRRSKERARREATERRRAARFKLDPDVAVMFGHCMDETDVETLKQTLHDNLIRMMGDRRTGGVSWIVARDDDARDLLRMLRETPDVTEGGHSTDWNEYVRRCSARLREYGGIIVAAMADGSPPT